MTEKKKEETKYTKNELIKCGKWNKYQLASLLKDDKMYTISEVEKIAKKG